MSVEYFQREIWCQKVEDGLDLELVLINHCTRKFEGDAEYAKTVRILSVGEPRIDSYTGKVEYEDMDDDKQNLNIDIQEYFSFNVKDVDKAQSMPGLDTAYQKKAVKRLAQRGEINVGRLVAGKCINTADEKTATYSKTSDTALIPYKDYYTREGSSPNYEYKRVKKPNISHVGNYYEITNGNFKEGATYKTTASSNNESAIKLAIDEAIVEYRLRNNEEGGFLELDPYTYMQFKNFITALNTTNPELIRKGLVGYYDGKEVTRSNAICNDGTYMWCFVHSGEAIAFVGQINEVEALRLQDKFGDGIRGLYTFGLKIVSQDELQAIKIPVRVRTSA